jgi:AraC-like DNA-binding protein
LSGGTWTPPRPNTCVRVRLDDAHHDLIAADPAHESVTTVAYRWGFPSPSRFAAYFRAVYDVLPGPTLRQR